MASDEIWHYVEAKRDDGSPTMFRIRELTPQLALTRIFVVEMPYASTELSKLPDAGAHRRLAMFEEQWLRPACDALAWEFVGSKTEDGSFFLYMYGATEPTAIVERLAPFDAALGFYDDVDATWAEYATLRELLDQAKAMPLPTTRMKKPVPKKQPKPGPKKQPKPAPKPKKTKKSKPAPKPKNKKTRRK